MKVCSLVATIILGYSKCKWLLVIEVSSLSLPCIALWITAHVWSQSFELYAGIK